MKEFKLIHVALYAKGHYLRSNNLYLDLAKCLQEDNYGPFIDEKTNDVSNLFKRDITRLIINKIREFVPTYRAEEILNNASPQECWKVGYYTKEHKAQKDWETAPDYNYWQAQLMAYLSELCFLSVDELGWQGKDINTSDKVLPIKRLILIQKLVEKRRLLKEKQIILLEDYSKETEEDLKDDICDLIEINNIKIKEIEKELEDYNYYNHKF